MSESHPVVIVDYGIGNTASVANMLAHIGAQTSLSSDPDVICHAKKLILPGVGAFDPGIAALRNSKLDVAIADASTSGGYVLGICLGAQLLLEESEEGSLPGLGLVPGRVRRFRVEEMGLRVPHIGWNVVTPNIRATLFRQTSEEQRFYFAHTYYIDCADPRDIAATCLYGENFICAFGREQVLGVQFHPEKSHRFGMDLFRRFVELPC